MAKKDKKRFSETGLGKFLKGAGSNIIGIVGDVLPDKGLLGIVKNLIDKDEAMSPEQKIAAHMLRQLEYQDIADARALQVAALNQDDLFSKRFVYYLAIGVFTFSAVIVLLLFWIEIPDKNRDVINFILGVVVGTGLTGVFQYFFGSSKGSKDKTDLLNGK